MKDEEWLRLPDEGERCEVSGLSRSSLSEILSEADPKTGEKFVLSLKKKKPGAKRGIVLINKASLLRYLAKIASAQSGLRWADRVGNPHEYEIDDVLSDKEIFHYFIGLDHHITDEAWDIGELSSRPSRLAALVNAGVLVKAG